MSPKTLSEDQISFYSEHGYLVVENVLDVESLSKITSITDEIVASAKWYAESDERLDLATDHRPDAPKVSRLKSPHRFYDSYRKLVASRVILDILKGVLGPNIRLYDSKLILKLPGTGSPVEWHQDWAFYPHTNHDMLAVGIALDDIDEENGPLMVIPGSHRGPVYDHHVDGQFSGAINYEHCDVDFSKAVPLKLKASSMSLHHTRLIHGSAQNASGRSRRLYLIEYNAADAWPIMSLPDTLEEFNSRIVAGEPTLMPRMEAAPVRIPLPTALLDTVYQYHRHLETKYFDWHDE